jgi:hypothetical protein
MQLTFQSSATEVAEALHEIAPRAATDESVEDTLFVLGRRGELNECIERLGAAGFEGSERWVQREDVKLFTWMTANARCSVVPTPGAGARSTRARGAGSTGSLATRRSLRFT